jgi:hypothetical protein
MTVIPGSPLRGAPEMTAGNKTYDPSVPVRAGGLVPGCTELREAPPVLRARWRSSS